MSVSSVPAAIDGLIALLGAATTLRGIAVIDGEPTNNLPAELIAVAFAEDGAAVTFTTDSRSLGNLSRGEFFDIACVVSVCNGTTVAKTVRDRAFTIYSAVESVVRNNGTLSGAVIFGQIDRGDVKQIQTDRGAVCDIAFTVSCESRI